MSMVYYRNMLAIGNCAFSYCWYINFTEARERLLMWQQPSIPINTSMHFPGSALSFITTEAHMTCLAVSHDDPACRQSNADYLIFPQRRLLWHSKVLINYHQKA